MTRIKVLQIISVFTFIVSVRTFSLQPLYRSEIGYFVDGHNFGSSINFQDSKNSVKNKRNSPYKIVSSDGQLRYLNHNYGPDDVFFNYKNDLPKTPVTNKNVGQKSDDNLKVFKNEDSEQLFNNAKHNVPVKGVDPVKFSASQQSAQLLHHKNDHHQEDSEKYDKEINYKHGAKSDKLYKTKHYHDISDKVKHHKHHKQNNYDEKGGKHNKHNDKSNHYNKYEEGEEQQKSSKFGEKKGHRKGHKSKEYHNTLHRDEYHKEHRFYDDAHKSGYHEKHGDHHSYYDKKSGGKKSGASHQSGHENKKFGKERESDKGHFEEEHEGKNSKEGHKKYHSKYNKNKHLNEHANGKHYGYIKGK